MFPLLTVLFISLLLPLDKDLLLFKATSAATLSCLGECLSMLQHNVVQALNQNQNQNHMPSPSNSSAGLNQAAAPDRVRSWSQRSTVSQVEPGGLRSESPTRNFNESHNHIQSQDREHAGEFTDGW